MRRSLFAVLILLAMSAAGCSSDDGTSSTVTPSPTLTTETFTAALGPKGEIIHTFTVSTTGTVTVGLTSVGPLSTMGLGVGVGAWTGAACSTSIAQNESARAGTAAVTGTATAGNYCVRVFDSGNVPSDWSVNYSVYVTHP